MAPVMEYSVHFERPHELANCFLFEHSGYATIALEDYAIEHWNRHHVEVAAGAMANPMGITQLSLSGTDYSARYESYLDFPLELHLKNNDGLANCAKVCRVRRWGEGVTRPPLVLDASLDMGGARVAPTLGPTRRGGGGGWHLFGYCPCATPCRVWGSSERSRSSARMSPSTTTTPPIP
jgi:hypothetical protein